MRDGEKVPPMAPEGRLWAAVVDWLANADVGEPAAVEMAELLDRVAGPPVVAVRGPAGIGVGRMAAGLRGRSTWNVVADEGTAPRADADAVVTLSHDPGAESRGGEVVVDPRRVLRDDAHRTPGALPGDDDGPLADVIDAVGRLVAPQELAGVRAGRLERGVAAIAAAHPVVRDELEDLLWP